MDARQYLYNVRSQWKEIENLQQRAEALRASLLPAAIRYDKEKVQTSSGDPTSDKMAALVDCSHDLEERSRRLAEDQRRAQDMIDTLDDTRERQVLEFYFLSIPPRSMIQTAREVGYSREHTYRIFERALQKLLNNDTCVSDSM